MKRLRHRLFNFAAAATLGILVATSICWLAASVTMPAQITTGIVKTGQSSIDATVSKRGDLTIEYWLPKPSDPEITPEQVRKEMPATQIGASMFQSVRPMRGIWFNTQRMPVRASDGTVGWRAYVFVTRIHVTWIIMLCTAILVTWTRLFLVNRRRRLIRSGHCLRCGYDLRATPARCPECGAIPPAAKGVAT
jgi:hypothetical protein